MSTVVVDTNVPIAANGGDEVPPDCAMACQAALLQVLKDEKRLAIDDDWAIIDEYRNKLSASGAPGLGDRFLRWVLTNWANDERCDRVPLTPDAADDTRFAEFPEGPGLDAFDPSDRKFVAVAHAHPGKPPILQGLDSKWWGWKDALAAAGVTVDFLCPTQVRANYERKFPAGRPSRPPRRVRG